MSNKYYKLQVTYYVFITIPRPPSFHTPRMQLVYLARLNSKRVFALAVLHAISFSFSFSFSFCCCYSQK